MNVHIASVTKNIYGGSFLPPLRFLNRYLADLWADAALPIEKLDIIFAYPPKVNDDEFRKWYDKLPYTRLNKKRGVFQITLAFPELAEYLRHKNTGCFLPSLTKKLLEIIDILETKLKNSDASDKMRRKLNIFQDKDIIEKLNDADKRYDNIAGQERLDRNLADRNLRQNADIKPNRLIYDLRFYCQFDGISNSYFQPFATELCGDILDRLRKIKFKLPNYTHIYIAVSDSLENALDRATRYETWFVYGLAVLKNPNEYSLKSEPEKKRIVFELIKEALLDVAKIDKLDMLTLEKTLNETKEKFLIKD